MADKNKNLKNHQLLEISGVEIFKKIQRKKIIENSKKESIDALNEQSSSDQK